MMDILLAVVFHQAAVLCGGIIQGCASPPVLGTLALPGARATETQTLLLSKTWDREDAVSVCRSLKMVFPVPSASHVGLLSCSHTYLCSVRLTPPFFFFKQFSESKDSVNYNIIVFDHRSLFFSKVSKLTCFLSLFCSY